MLKNLVIIVLIIIIFHILDKPHPTIKATVVPEPENKMLKRYKSLISLLIMQFGVKIIEMENTKLKLVGMNSYGTQTFELIHSKDNITVTWEVHQRGLSITKRGVMCENDLKPTIILAKVESLVKASEQTLSQYY